MVREAQIQCDQIGLFWKVVATNFTTKVAQKSIDVFGLFWKVKTVRVPSTPSTLFSIVQIVYLSFELECEKNENKQKEAGIGPFF